MLRILILLLVSIPLQAQEPDTHKDVLTLLSASPHQKFENTRLVAIGPGGDYMVVARSGARLTLFDNVQSTQVKLSIPPSLTSASFSSKGDAVLFGSRSGKMLWVDLTREGPHRVIDLQMPEKTPLEALSLSPDGRQVAWSSRRARRAGLNELEEGTAISTWEGVWTVTQGSHPGPLVHFTRDGTHLVFYRQSHEQGARKEQTPGGLVLWSLADQSEVARLRPEVANRTLGYVLTDAGLMFAARAGPNREIRQREVVSGKERTFTSQSRPGPFTDLYLSPGGGVLAEWDFRKKGIRIYDLTEKQQPRTLAGTPAPEFLGFHADPARELLISQVRGKPEISIWDPANGKLLGEMNPLPEGTEGFTSYTRFTTIQKPGLILLGYETSPGKGKKRRSHLITLQLGSSGHR